jgi:hypothetical protein
MRWSKLFEIRKRWPIANTKPPSYASGGVIHGSGADSDSVPMVLSDCLYIPTGTDPYTADLADGECALSASTGRCVRDHPAPDGGHAYDATRLAIGRLNRRTERSGEEA